MTMSCSNTVYNEVTSIVKSNVSGVTTGKLSIIPKNLVVSCNKFGIYFSAVVYK